MQRYSASIESTHLNSNNVAVAIEFAFMAVEQSGIKLPRPAPAMKQQAEQDLIDTGRAAFEYPTANRGTLTAVVTDRLFESANQARKKARELYAVGGELEISDDQPVKYDSEKDQWLVEAWVWVDAESAGCDDLDDDADEDNIETAYIAAAEHPAAEIGENARASLGNDPGAYVSAWITVSGHDVRQQQEAGA